MERDLEFLILGPFEIRSAGNPLRLPSPKQRALLGVLLLHANEVVSVDRLIDDLWREKPPETATNLLQVYVSQLRKLLEPERARREPRMLVTRAPGYMLRVEPEKLDHVRFERLVNEGVAALDSGEYETAFRTLQKALEIWRGPVLADFAFEEFAVSESTRLQELRLHAIEERIEASLALGRHAALVGELDALVAEHPLRERLAQQLMLALYRSRRQAEALDVYARTRRRLVEQLGVEPSPDLQRLEKAILNQDPLLDLPKPSSTLTVEPAQAPDPTTEEPRARPSQTARKTVTVLVANCVLTPLRAETIDPETLEPVFAHLVERLPSVVERYGGSIHWPNEVEFVAVFGIPRVHEDDALRAVLSAVELREAIASSSARLATDFGVSVEVRIGINTGQIVAGASLAMGGASSVAANLGRAAPVREIHLADTTRHLVRDAIVVEPARRHVEGQASGTVVWRLLEVVAGAAGVERRLSSPMVGRVEELEALRRVYDSIGRERCASLVTIVGPAGIGKSHLARALVTTVGNDCRVLLGRSLAYGEGSTFAPLAEIVRQVGADDPLDTIRAVVADDAERDLIAERIASAIGLSEGGGGSETTFWAVRKFLEALARERPLILVLDDLHWAEPTLLDLVEYVVDWTLDAPILVLGLARPEFLDERPAWAGGKRNVSSLVLAPLTDAESDMLIDNLVGDSELDASRRSRIREAAAGNPFFVEQMLAMHAGDGASGVASAIPPTIQALLAARLDRLEPEQRSALEHASIMGKEFWRAAVSELVPEESRDSLGSCLRELVRKQLIEPCRSALPVGDALRFHSALIRDAVYESVPKRSRAVLHERVARWLERAAAEQLSQYEEVLGYHFEQAFRYHEELGPLDDHGRAVGQAGANRLAAAGRRAFALGDMSAAASLFGRAAALLPVDDPTRLELLPMVGEALHETGEFESARAVLGEAIEQAALQGDSGLGAKARLIRALVEASSGAEGPGESVVREAERAAPIFEEVGDDEGLATAARMLAWAHGTAGRYGDAADAARRAIEHAGRAGDQRQRARATTQYALAALHGPTPVTEAIARCREIVDEVGGDRLSEGLVTSVLGWLEAMRGDFGLARELAQTARTLLVDLGTSVLAASTSQESGQIEMLAEEPAGAERLLRRDYEDLTRLGETYLLSTVAGDLGQAVYAQGRYEEALELSQVAERLAAEDDVTSQSFWRSVRAKVLVRQGRLEEAALLAEEAVGLLRRTDALVTLARALVDLAEVLVIGERPAAARACLEEAVELLERKENAVGARQARRRLETLAGPPIGLGV